MTLLTKEQTMAAATFLDAPLVVQFDPVIHMDDDQFYHFCTRDLTDIWEADF
jgi:hypothetical protein